MIVSCGNCQTRFRLADERVTARGLKVRCSRCGEVFIVHREEPAAPPAPAFPDGDLGFVPGAVPPDALPTTRLAPPATALREAAAPPEPPPVAPPEPSGSFCGFPPPGAFAAEPGPGWQPWSPDLAPAPVPDLPGLPGGGPRPAPPARAEAPAPAGPPRPPEAVTAPLFPRPPVPPPAPRRRERPPTGGLVAAFHVAAGAALLVGLLFAVAPAGDPDGDRVAEVIRLFTGDPGEGPEIEPVDLRAAIRETAAGERSLVVAGAVARRREPRAAPVRVTAELIAGDRVLAREEALAWDGAGAAGDRVPFQLVFREVPPELARAGLRVTARYGTAAPEVPAPAVPAPEATEAPEAPESPAPEVSAWPD